MSLASADEPLLEDTRSTESAAESTAAAASSEPQPEPQPATDADDDWAETELRRRGAKKAKAAAEEGKAAGASGSDAAAAAAIAASSAAAAAAAGGDSKTEVHHVHQGRSRSSAHICSNKQRCPLVQAFDACATDAERDALPLSEEVFACSACKSMLYCSLECQKDAWLHGHNKECAKLSQTFEEKHGLPPANADAAAPAPRRRMLNIDLDVQFGPRAIITIMLILYLIYRFLGRAAPAAVE